MRTAFLTAFFIVFGSFSGLAGEYSKSPIEAKQPVADTGGTYIFAYGGGSFFDDDGLTFDWQGVPGATASNDLENGFILGGGVGLKSSFLGGSRFELEGIYSKFGAGLVADPVGNLYGSGPSGGDFEYRAVLFNFLKEFDIEFLGVTAYAGGGIGMAWTDVSIYTAGGGPLFNGGEALAYQFILGADYPLGDRLDLYTQYKFIGVGDTSAVDFANFGYDVNSFYTHNVIVGLKLNF